MFRIPLPSLRKDPAKRPPGLYWVQVWAGRYSSHREWIAANWNGSKWVTAGTRERLDEALEIMDHGGDVYRNPPEVQTKTVND